MLSAPSLVGPIKRRQSVAPVRHRRRNLILVGKACHEKDFTAIVKLIRELAPDVRATFFADRSRNGYRFDLMLRPTLVFSPLPLDHLHWRRGAVFQGQRLSKSQECLLLEKHGVPVPRWAKVTKDHMPDLTAFAKYVVCKPDMGGRGAEVKVKRKTRIRWKPPENIFARFSSDLLVQEFIYTGAWPVSYRVGTLFGKAIYSWKVEADRRRRPLRGPDVFADGPEGGGMSIVSTGHGCTFELNNDRDIIALAERAHAAMPDVPLLGVDIVRDHFTGQLYVIEVNSWGATWYFSSDTGLSIQKTGGFDLTAQFDGLRRSAEILIETTRQRAA